MGPPLEYPYGRQGPPPAEAVELAAGVHWLRMPLPSSLEHINLWLLADGDAWTIVDCGIDSEALKRHWEHLFRTRLNGAAVPRIVVTHFHSDHLGLAHWLCERLDASLWIAAPEYHHAQLLHAATAEQFGGAAVEHLVRHGVSDEELLRNVRDEPTPYRRLVPRLPEASHLLVDGDELDIGKNTWHAIAGEGHSPQHLALYCASLGILIAGDMLLPAISAHIGVTAIDPLADPLPKFLASIDRFLSLPSDTLVLPSHGEPFRGIAARVAQLHRHHAERFERVLAACDEPRSAAHLVPILFQRTLDQRQYVLALNEALAHLHALESAGQLVRKSGGGVIQFERVRVTDRPAAGRETSGGSPK